MKNQIKTLGIALAKLLTVVLVIGMFVVCSGKNIYNWEFWVFVLAIAAYGITTHMIGYKEGLNYKYNVDIQEATDLMEVEVAKRAAVKEILETGNHQEKLDLLLDKISFEGTDALNEVELELLNKLSK